jgi:hypothetical protein
MASSKGTWRIVDSPEVLPHGNAPTPSKLDLRTQFQGNTESPTIQGLESLRKETVGHASSMNRF